MSDKAGKKDGEDGGFDAIAKALFELWERFTALQSQIQGAVLPPESAGAAPRAANDALKLWLLAAAGHSVTALAQASVAPASIAKVPVAGSTAFHGQPSEPPSSAVPHPAQRAATAGLASGERGGGLDEQQRNCNAISPRLALTI
jgi:hypothetical protein